jgi:hypothetical protein
MRAAVDGAVFTKDIRIADFKFGWLTDVFQILSLSSHHRERKKLILFPKSRDPFNHHVAMQHAVIAERNVSSDNAVRADPDIFSKLGLWRNDGGGVNHVVSFKAIERL